MEYTDRLASPPGQPEGNHRMPHLPNQQGTPLVAYALVLVLIAVVVIAVYIWVEPAIGDLITQLKNSVP